MVLKREQTRVNRHTVSNLINLQTQREEGGGRGITVFGEKPQAISRIQIQIMDSMRTDALVAKVELCKPPFSIVAIHIV